MFSLPRSIKRLSLTLSSRNCSSSTAHYVCESVSLDIIGEITAFILNINIF